MKTNLLCIAFAVMMTPAAVAQDAPATQKRGDAAGRNNAAAAAVLKRLQDVDLTEEQKAKIQQMAKKAMAEMRSFRKESGITPELMKKRVQATKELRQSGTKPAEMFAAVSEKLALTEAQATALKKSDAMRQNLTKSAIAVLTEEQKAKLPKRMLRAVNKTGGAKGKGQAKGKGKKNKSE